MRRKGLEPQGEMQRSIFASLREWIGKEYVAMPI